MAEEKADMATGGAMTECPQFLESWDIMLQDQALRLFCYEVYLLTSVLLDVDDSAGQDLAVASHHNR